MAMFGEVVPFITFAGGGLIGLKYSLKFLNPRHGHMHLVGLFIAIFFFGAMVIGSTIQFFDPPAPTPVKVAPIAMPGQSPYAAPSPTPYGASPSK